MRSVSLGRQSGFSLLEVLVAFAILAISIGILMQVFSNGMRGASVVRHYSNAMIVAESRLQQLLAESPVQPGVSTGVEDDFYHWQLVLSEYPLPSEQLGKAKFSAYQASVTVAWGLAEDQRRRITLDTLLLAEK